jgi:hypothetical protein
MTTTTTTTPREDARVTQRHHTWQYTGTQGADIFADRTVKMDAMSLRCRANGAVANSDVRTNSARAVALPDRFKSRASMGDPCT